MRAFVCIVLGLAGCNEESDNWASGSVERSAEWLASPAHSIPRAGALDKWTETGKAASSADLQRGQEQYAIFCGPCHGMTGNGDGIVVRYGFLPPPSFHTAPVREILPEAIVDAVTNGVGRMLPMAERIPPADRWRVAAYVKALQGRHSAPPSQTPGGQGSPE